MDRLNRAFVSSLVIASVAFSPLGMTSAQADQKTVLAATQEAINAQLRKAKDNGTLPLYWEIGLADDANLNDPQVRANAQQDLKDIEKHMNEQLHTGMVQGAVSGAIIGFGAGSGIGFAMVNKRPATPRSLTQPSVSSPAPVIFQSELEALQRAQYSMDTAGNPTIAKGWMKEIATIRKTIDGKINFAAQNEVQLGLLGLWDSNLKRLLVKKLWFSETGELEKITWKDNAETNVKDADWSNVFKQAEKASSGSLVEIHQWRLKYRQLFRYSFEQTLARNLREGKLRIIRTLRGFTQQELTALEVLGQSDFTRLEVTPSGAQDLLIHQFNGDPRRVEVRLREMSNPKASERIARNQAVVRDFAELATRGEGAVEPARVGERSAREGRAAEVGSGHGGAFLTILALTALGAIGGAAVSWWNGRGDDLDHVRAGDVPWDKEGNLSVPYVANLISKLKTLSASQGNCGQADDDACYATLTTPQKYLMQASERGK